MSFKKSLLLAAIAASAFSAQAQNIVVNGSFEDIASVGSDSQAPGSFGTYTSIVGWTGTPNIEVRDSYYGVAQNLTNFVELDTNKRSAGLTNSGMYQDITATGLYELSFWYSARPNTWLSTNGLGFTFGGLSGQVLQPAVGGSDVKSGSSHVWRQYTGLVNLAGTTTLNFYANGTADTLGGSIDNVSVTAVPEPESLAMMLAGLGLMGTIARRRKQKAA